MVNVLQNLNDGPLEHWLRMDKARALRNLILRSLLQAIRLLRRLHIRFIAQLDSEHLLQGFSVTLISLRELRRDQVFRLRLA